MVMWMISQWQLRASVARRLSAMYGREVPAYTSTQRIKLTLDPRHAARPGRRPTISGDEVPHER